ncbi:uncharacterized protein DS421_4g119200 [Arachis hypogaea]|nr:uncharacterized protein DS421_4g119200 [Arachis hypogaea]
MWTKMRFCRNQWPLNAMVHSPNNGNGVTDRQKVKSSGSIWKKRQPEISPAKTAENGNKDLEEESDDVGLKKLLQEKKRKMEFVFGGDSKAAELEFERLSKLKTKLDSMKMCKRGPEAGGYWFGADPKSMTHAIVICGCLVRFCFPRSCLCAIAIVTFQPLGRRCCRRLPPLDSSFSEALQSPTWPLRLQFEKVIILFWGFVIPSSLSAIDHWSPEVKGQGMVCFGHLGKNVAEIGSYADLLFMEPKNEQPNSSKKAKDLNIEGYPVGGLSIGGHETCIIFPTLKVAFDIGRCPPRAVSQDFLLISHAHMDHIGGLPMYVATRGLYRMKPPTIIVPISVKEDVEKLFEVHRKMDHSELKHNLIGLDVGEEFYLRKDLKVKAFRTYHVISSQGYILYYVRQKLKPEYIGLSGNEIKNLKSSGVEITYTLTEPEVAFTGDTMSDFIVDESNTDVLRARILVIECTFVNNSITVEHAKDYGHTHLSEIIGYAERFKNRAILLIHFSARYTVEEIEEAVTGLPPPLAGRTFALTEGF